MKIASFILLIFICNINHAQEGFAEWNKNYKFKPAEKIIQSEVEYAKEVEKDTKEGHYYVAMEKYRFTAEYTGRERPIPPQVLSSMSNVLRLKLGSAEILNGLVSKEFEFNIGKSKIWMPIQNQLIEYLKSELEAGQEVLLYCLFFNEHTFDGSIINTFLISEFTTEWE